MQYTILVVDDDADERDAMVGLLRRHHYRVESATNGRQALDRLLYGTSLPAAVLLDLNMPVMGGWEFLFHVTRDGSLCRVPVVVISGHLHVQEAIVAPPGVSFLAKPVHPGAIVNALADLLPPALALAAVSDSVMASVDDVDTAPQIAASLEAVPEHID